MNLQNQSFKLAAQPLFSLFGGLRLAVRRSRVVLIHEVEYHVFEGALRIGLRLEGGIFGRKSLRIRDHARNVVTRVAPSRRGDHDRVLVARRLVRRRIGDAAFLPRPPETAVLGS